jgi:hypothetical protein
MSKLGTFIPRPNRKFKSATGNAYIKIDGKVCMIDSEAAADWDNLEEIQVESVHYDASMLPEDATGKPTGPAFDRLEITDYKTFGRNDKLADVVVSRELRARKLMTETTITSKDGALALAD